MPAQSRVAVDSSPKLHGLFDTINATHAASDKRTRLPEEFYDERAREIMDRILMEEEYAGYAENSEYRTLGIGPMLRDAVQRMVNRAHYNTSNGQDTRNPEGNGMMAAIALFGCHDSTLAATLASLGASKGENARWPAYTSSLAIELFRSREGLDGTRQSASDISSHYVRMRYNDRPVVLPGCQRPSDHLEGDASFCTLVGVSECVMQILHSQLIVKIQTYC